MKKKETIPTSYVLGLIIHTPETKTWAPKSSCCEHCNPSNPSSDSCSQKHLRWAVFSQSHRKLVQMLPGDRQKSHDFSFHRLSNHPRPSLLVANTYAATYLTTCLLPPSSRDPRLTSLQSIIRTEHLCHQLKNLQRCLKDKIHLQTLEFFLPGSNSTSFSTMSIRVWPYSRIPIANPSTSPPPSFSSPSSVLSTSQGPAQITLLPHSFLWLQLLPISSLPKWLWQLQCVTQRRHPIRHQSTTKY